MNQLDVYTCRCCCRRWAASVVSDSVQPTRPPSLGVSSKNTGVGCHVLLQCMKVKSESEVAQSCPTLPDPMDCSPPGSSVHGIFQARALEWGAVAFSDVHIWPLFFGLPSHLDHHRALSRAPCAIEWVLIRFSLVPQSCLTLGDPDSLQPQKLKHTRLPCPSPTPRACSNSCPSSW